MKKIIITETQVKNLLKEAVNDEVYFSTFSGAVQYARQKVENRGYEVNEDDWFNEVNTGQGRPKEGNTTRMSIGLIKNGKPQRKMLHIQVFNKGNSHKHNFELNYYVI